MTNEEKIMNILSGMRDDISGMRDDISGIRGDISGMQGEISGMRDDISGMQGDISGMQGDISGMRDDISSMQTDIVKINIKLEAVIEPKIEALAEGQLLIQERLIPRSRVDDLEDEVKFLKTVVRQMNEDIQQLKKAQ